MCVNKSLVGFKSRSDWRGDHRLLPPLSLIDFERVSYHTHTHSPTHEPVESRDNCELIQYRALMLLRAFSAEGLANVGRGRGKYTQKPERMGLKSCS